MEKRSAAIHQAAAGLHLIVLPQARPGFEDFIGAWLYRDGAALLVDPGPAASIPALAAALKRLDVRRLDAVLLTHIHIDHAGGCGDLLAHFPDTPVICHPKAVRHLADPTRLWEGSLATLGEIARDYGPIAPVPAERLQDATALDRWGIESFLTPGHAPHHVSFLAGPWLFAGEAAGVCRHLPGGDRYLRPATPPRYHPDTGLASLDRLRRIPHRGLCYGHLGLFTDTPELLDAHRDQLLLWAREIGAEMTGGGDAESLVARCRRRLEKADPLLAGLGEFDDAVRARETYFIENSIRGFVGYLAEQG